MGVPGNRALPVLLWGRPVILVLSKKKDKEAIHDIQFHDVENGKIVALKSYFFRKEFLLAATCELRLNAQLVKPPVDWN